MKRILLAALILFASNVFAQNWVQVPDANFQNYLTAHYPAGAFMTSGSDFFMDSDFPDIQSETILDVYQLNISNLNGLQAFTNLLHLNCEQNQLTSLPDLPTSLVTLNCNNNQLTALPDLTGVLYYLFCGHNQLVELPELPSSLNNLNCNFNQLTELPALPASLQYLDCFNNQLTQLPALPAFLNQLSCAENPITALPALPANLTNLYCVNNELSDLPLLPSTLLTLHCSGNNLIDLPDLPAGLTHLDCDHNLIMDLPELPSGLLYLQCNSNQLTDLPDLPAPMQMLGCSGNGIAILPTLPDSLQALNCGENILTQLPVLPLSLKTLQCFDNQLSVIPDLPDGLLELTCFTNQLTSLPGLPISLTLLNCDVNFISVLPDLPPDLNLLLCSGNQLSNLPDLPESLRIFSCSNNQITSLPELPDSLEQLFVHSNQITCFGEFPSSLQQIYLEQNLFTCLPNYISAMDAAALAYPLCSANDPVNNPNGCAGASGIQGSVFNDVNNDCVDSGLPLIYIPMVLNDDNGNLLTSSTNLVNGDYYFAAGQGDYEVEVNTTTLNPSVQVNCPVANELTATITAVDPIVNAGDFGLACAGFDLGVQSVVPTGWFFPGQVHTLDILAGDLTAQYNMHCASGISGDITISVTGPGSVTFGGTPTNISGNTATYTLADFGALGANIFSASVLTDTTAQTGDEFCVSVVVTTAASGDLNPANNTYNFCYPVMNSYDPNIKLTTPELVDPGYEDEFTYTIYFQNTGNAPAFNIRLADTLDANLDLTTLKFVNGSHAFTTSLNADSRLLSIRFPNIMLADSTTDPEGSIGFIQYRVKPVSGLPNGTIIRNTAYIYFDFNSPIITNTSENWFSSVGLNELAETNVVLYPNPATTTVTFESDETIDQLEFFNLNGAKVKTLQPNGKKAQVDISAFDNGVYIVKVYSETGVMNKRLVINK